MQQQPNRSGTPEPPTDVMHPDRLVPHSVEAEEATLGSVLLDSDTLLDVADYVTPADFFIVKHAWIFEAMLTLSEKNQPIDYLTLIEKLRQDGRLEEIGGAAYITYLLNNTPTYIYGTIYAELVHRAAIRRRLLSAASDIAMAARAEDADIHEVIDRAEAALFEAVGSDNEQDEWTAEQVASAHYDKVEKMRDAKVKLSGIPSGFLDVDSFTGGWQNGNLIIVAGRPGSGKTSWLISAAINAMSQGKKVGLFSLEMSKDEIIQRMKSAMSQIPSQKMRTGALNEFEWKEFVSATGKVSTMPLWIITPNELTPMRLRMKARRLRQKYGIDLIMIDYLQLMTGGKRFENRTQEVTYISRTTKLLAGLLEIPIIAAAQLNRNVEGRADKTPMLSDLRESGSIEQDSDVVIFLHRDEMYNENTQRPNQADVIIAKQRNGPIGTATLYFRKEITQFTNLRKTDIDLAGF